jgi:hypothetical protein
MSQATPTIQWSEAEPPAAVYTGQQLEKLLEELTWKAHPEFPIAVRLRAHDCELDILLGMPESFVFLNSPTARQSFITVGNPDATGVVGFYLFGQHHTEFERRHLISFETAKRVLCDFLTTACRTSNVIWEEQDY